MNKLFALLLIIGSPLQAAAQSPASQTPPKPIPLEAQERIDQMEKLIDKLNGFEASVGQMIAEKKRGCVRAVGNEAFCNCIVDGIPVVMDFPQYVAILVASKDDLHYDTLSPDDKKAIDMARQSRDKCVKSQQPVTVKVLPTER